MVAERASTCLPETLVVEFERPLSQGDARRSAIERPEPRTEKERRLRALDRQIRRLEQNLARLQRTSYRYSWIRIAIFGGGLLATVLCFFLVGPGAAALCAAATVLSFGGAVYGHRQVNGSIRRHRIWRRRQMGQVARARLDWERIPTTFPHQAQPDHPFESDLDLIGQRSLHRLLDTAVSYEGSQRLRAWLTETAPDQQQTAERQQRVRELAPLHLFRSRLALNATAAAGANKAWRASQLVEWLEQRAPEARLRPWLLLFAALAGLNAALFVANRLGWLPAWWMITLAVYLGLWLAQSRELEAVWDEALALQGALQQLRAVFRQLETFSYRNTPGLGGLCKPFLDPAHRPSRYLARVGRVVAATGLRANPMIRFALNAVVPWDIAVAYGLSQTKAGLAHHAPTWMEAWFELEALCSLANLAYLNPGYSFPSLTAAGQEGGAVLEAEELGHPLIPDEERVCNDLEIPELGRVMVITGSNMAGKSVFLKTVGINLALAYAGGPVNARRLQAGWFRIFTCMGISDSVTDGISYFYAEVRRLKALLTALEEDHALPLLFGIDEIFRGTNNRERMIGSRAYVRALVGKRGLGLIATHDLELARLADELPQVQNHHFRDRVVGERMAFDYKLRPGPYPTTNALKIMRLEGLPVEDVEGKWAGPGGEG